MKKKVEGKKKVTKKKVKISKGTALEISGSPVPLTAVATVPTDINQIMMHAISHKGGVDVIERLVALRERMDATVARREFFDALAKFQAECPIIDKIQKIMDKDEETNRASLTKVKYKFANFESIIFQAGPSLKNNGFSYSFTTRFENDRIYATCHAHHVGGHTEDTEVSMPIEKNKFRTEPQHEGATITYAKRYSFNCAFGIVTADPDSDANKASQEALKERKMAMAVYAEGYLIERNSKWPSDKSDWAAQWMKRAVMSYFGAGKTIATDDQCDIIERAMENEEFNIDTAVHPRELERAQKAQG